MPKKHHLPTVHALRPLAAKHAIDPRTILRALQDKPIRGALVAAAAAAAVNEWRDGQNARAEAKRRDRKPGRVVAVPFNDVLAELLEEGAVRLEPMAKRARKAAKK